MAEEFGYALVVGATQCRSSNLHTDRHETPKHDPQHRPSHLRVVLADDLRDLPAACRQGRQQDRERRLSPSIVSMAVSADGFQPKRDFGNQSRGTVVHRDAERPNFVSGRERPKLIQWRKRRHWQPVGLLEQTPRQPAEYIAAAERLAHRGSEGIIVEVRQAGTKDVWQSDCATDPLGTAQRTHDFGHEKG
ncbi:hypothetical protein [Methylorubrum extorquens]